MKKIMLCGALILLHLIGYAQQNATLKGMITDVDSSKGIPNVSISILNAQKGTATNQQGYYSITVPTGEISLVITAIGYEDKTLQTNISSASKTLNISLQKSVTSLSQVVIGHSTNRHNRPKVGKLNIENLDNPIVINTLSPKVMEQRNVTDLGDAVKSVTGVRPINRYGGFQTFRIRGFNNFVLLIDGVRDERHNLSTSAPSTNLANVDYIEVLKGPAGVLYGHSALGGIINLVRKRPTDQQTGNVTATYGSFDTYNASFGIGGPISETLKYRADFGITRTNGWRDYGVETNNGALMLEFSPTQKDAFEFYIQANNDVYDTDTGIPVDEDGSLIKGMDPETRYNDPQDYLRHKRFDYQLKYTHTFSDDLKLSNHLSYSDDDIDYLSTEFLEVNETKDSITRAFPFYFNHTTKTLQNQLDLSYTFKTGKISHTSVAGYSLSYLDRKTFRGEVIGEGTFSTIAVQNPILNQGHIEAVDKRVDVKEEFVNSFFIQDLIHLLPKVKVMIGMRYDIFNGTYYRDEIDNNRNVLEYGEKTKIPSTAFTLRSGLVYQPTKHISIFSSYSDYFKPTRRIAPNGQVFDPETGYQTEAGIKYQNKVLAATFSAFYMLKNNIVEKTSVEDYRQIGEADSKGIEFDIQAHPINGLFIKAGYAFADASISDYNRELQTTPEGNQLPFAPKHLANAWVSYKLPTTKFKGLGIGFGMNHTSANYTNSDNTYELPAYTTLDGTLFYEIKNARIAFNLNNITDELYFTDAIYANQYFVGQERNYKISLSYSF
ncbi:TonB-dependent receptor [Aquimarina sp. TRL1]|uniref:TonB-dependent receptor n=1 Tax=Aquimarina sp. (strain TRL1) TaxID=2736252 RepID=UPI00158BF5EB|nr:TonB-dependent receptor [Aquimarina sp. TRL1]QKX07075.1 TonB-dependent receptor [Aquimarina sp. TRL1]